MFYQCHTLVAIREPSMRDLQNQLQLARKEFTRQGNLWSAKRTQIEMELSHGFFPRPFRDRQPSNDVMHRRIASIKKSEVRIGNNNDYNPNEFLDDTSTNEEGDDTYNEEFMDAERFTLGKPVLVKSFNTRTTTSSFQSPAKFGGEQHYKRSSIGSPSIVISSSFIRNGHFYWSSEAWVFMEAFIECEKELETSLVHNSRR